MWAGAKQGSPCLSLLCLSFVRPSLQTQCLSQTGGGSGCSSILSDGADIFRSDFRFLRNDHPWTCQLWL